MSNIKVDYEQISINSVSSTDCNGIDYQIDAYVIPVNIPLNELSSLIENFNLENPDSPDAETSLDIARIILSALKMKIEQG